MTGYEIQIIKAIKMLIHHFAESGKNPDLLTLLEIALEEMEGKK
jgi:hypothetical protein